MAAARRRLPTLGWREWLALPELGIAGIKAKVDTGARTSALHAFNVERFRRGSKDRVRFLIHPLQQRSDIIIECIANLVDERVVTDSGGHREPRLVILTPVVIGTEQFPIEITLTARETMHFRMLLGRTALRKRYVVDAAGSYLAQPQHKPGS
jgi:hypothetical protein